MIRSHVLICGGTGCTSSGSVALRDKLAEELKAKGLDPVWKDFDTSFMF
jgi:NADP-reducing hydrogenase subunit HndC